MIFLLLAIVALQPATQPTALTLVKTLDTIPRELFPKSRDDWNDVNIKRLHAWVAENIVGTSMQFDCVLQDPKPSRDGTGIIAVTVAKEFPWRGSTVKWTLRATFPADYEDDFVKARRGQGFKFVGTVAKFYIAPDSHSSATFPLAVEVDATDCELIRNSK